MARRSGVENFVKNFSAVYGAANQLGREFELKGISGQKEFLDEEDNPLTGLAKDNAKVQAMADVYTKYGDPEKGLKLVSDNYSNQLSKSKNRVQLETADAQIEAGNLAPREAQARIGASQASASASSAAAGLSSYKLDGLVQERTAMSDLTGAFNAKLDELNVLPNSPEANRLMIAEIMASSLPIDKRMEMAEIAGTLGSSNLARSLDDMANQGRLAMSTGNGGKAAAGLEGLVSWYDGIDGDKTRLKISSDGTKILEIDRDGKELRTLVEAKNQQELQIKAEQALLDPGNTAVHVAGWLDREAKRADIDATNQQIDASKAQTDVNKRNAKVNEDEAATNAMLGEARVKKIESEILNSNIARDLNASQTDLVRQKIKKAVMEQTGLIGADKEKEFIRASSKFLSDYLIERPDGEDLDAAYANFRAKLTGAQFRVIR